MTHWRMTLGTALRHGAASARPSCCGTREDPQLRAPASFSRPSVFAAAVNHPSPGRGTAGVTFGSDAKPKPLPVRALPIPHGPPTLPSRRLRAAPLPGTSVSSAATYASFAPAILSETAFCL